MTSPSAILVCGCASPAFLLSGCIPGSSRGSEGQQEVVVEVTDIDLQAVESAQVTAAHDFRGSFTVDYLPNDDASYLDRNQLGSAVSDSMGQALLVLPTVTVCHVSIPIIPVTTFESCPNPSSDQVTGEQYLFQIATESASEFFSLSMRPGAAVEGDLFTLTIVSIGEATPRS